MRPEITKISVYKMDVKTWLSKAKQQIDALDAELIALRNFAPRQADRSWLVGHGEEKIDQKRPLADKMLQRRQTGFPLAYILGEKEFYGRNFIVTPEVLIPRPETEDLISLIKNLKLPKQANFLEIGTGSGCIAITLALEYPQGMVVASDLSTAALRVAERNNLRHEGRVELVRANLLKDFEFGEFPEHFNVVVANLPYVDKAWDWVDEENLRFEPERALYARGNSGLSVYQRFLREYQYYNGVDGLWADYLVLEADPCQHQKLIKMAERAGLIYLKTEGFGLLFEDKWRYWYNYQDQTYTHKSQKILDYEAKTGDISWAAEELN